MSTTLIIVASATPATVLGALAMWLPAKWSRDAAAEYRDRADKTFAEAESLADEVERTRNLPWHYAAEAGELEEQPEPWVADEDAWAAAALRPVDAEVLHVEHATGELPLPALSDRPAEDEDEVGDEQPGEASSEAPAKLWQRFAAWWRSLPWVERWSDWRAQREEEKRYEAEFWDRLNKTAEQIAAEEAERRVEIETWVERTGRHGSDVHAVDTGYRGQRWAQDVQHTGQIPVVPAQRSGDADADA